MLDLWTETRELARRLDEEELAYAVAGAVALAVHGVVRATADIDLLVRAEDVDAVLALARGLDYRIDALPLRFADGTEMRRVTKVEGEDAVTLDLIPVGEHLEGVWEERRRVETTAGPLWVVSREGLMRMKAAAGRDQDLADIRRLEELDR